MELPYHLSPAEIVETLNMSTNQATALCQYLRTTTSTFETYKSQGIHILTPFHDSYPLRLSQIYDPPWVLYVKGNLELLHKPYTLGVVGTRTPSMYGRDALQRLLPPLIKQGVSIISGMAKGTDTIAHSLVIKEKGYTIAVLGSGFHHIYPRENEALAHHLSTSHLLVTEYPPNTPPRKWQFPMRNRIISGLSDTVFVSEAGERSGSLITAYQGLEQGKEVRALPGSIFSSMSKGTNQLIKEGAEPVVAPEDLLL
ncbi:DNA-processing protein DprA [Salibacterium salarium]|uniref:DNA-processing protein DprA n=1 Tax=Salibacterium salarium TaxID=284579 RepID=UPI001FE6D6CD|nr:DNA-processing protein DprA [Salibacterium salarium]